MTLSRQRLADALEAFAAAQLLVLVAILSIAAALFAAGLTLGRFVLPVAVMFAVVGIRGITGSWQRTAPIVALSAILHVAAWWISSIVPDNSFDGLAYHQEAVLRLAAGWNPFYGNAADYGVGNETFINSYPKASWISGAAVLLSTGQIEAGKLWNLTMIVTAGAAVTCALLRLTNFRPLIAVGVGLLAALNPVSVSQSTSFVVDGLIASAVAILIASVSIWVVELRLSSLIAALLAFVLLVNLKFTGLVYGGVFFAAAGAMIWYRHGFRRALELAAISLLAVSVSTLLFGYSPYVRNVREHGDPFYPIHGALETIGLGPNGFHRPANMLGRNRVAAFLISNFSFSQGVRTPNSTTLKIPFRVSREELWGRVYEVDIEAGGFGPLYSGLLLLACGGAVLLVARPEIQPYNRWALTIAVSILATMFFHTEAWWARYAPQAWLLPLLVLIPSLSLPRRSLAWSIGCGLLLFAVVNVLVVLGNTVVGQFQQVRTTSSALLKMSEASQPVKVYLGGFEPLRRRLHEAGIQFVEVSKEGPSGSVRHPLPSSGGHRSFWFE